MERNRVDMLIKKPEFRMIVRLVLWLKRFAHNTKPREKLTGPWRREFIDKSTGI